MLQCYDCSFVQLSIVAFLIIEKVVPVSTETTTTPTILFIFSFGFGCCFCYCSWCWSCRYSFSVLLLFFFWKKKSWVSVGFSTKIEEKSQQEQNSFTSTWKNTTNKYLSIFSNAKFNKNSSLMNINIDICSMYIYLYCDVVFVIQTN